jgi:hypothetical protein
MSDPGFENAFCGKTMVRVTKLPDGNMAVEAWIPVPGAPDGWYWLGYTGPMPLANYVSVDSFVLRPGESNETQDPISDGS